MEILVFMLHYIVFHEFKNFLINLNIILQQINYTSYEWMLRGDLKVVSMLVGQQKGYRKFLCFICQWQAEQGIYIGPKHN